MSPVHKKRIARKSVALVKERTPFQTWIRREQLAALNEACIKRGLSRPGAIEHAVNLFLNEKGA